MSEWPSRFEITSIGTPKQRGVRVVEIAEARFSFLCVVRPQHHHCGAIAGERDEPGGIATSDVSCGPGWTARRSDRANRRSPSSKLPEEPPGGTLRALLVRSERTRPV